MDGVSIGEIIRSIKLIKPDEKIRKDSKKKEICIPINAKFIEDSRPFLSTLKLQVTSNVKINYCLLWSTLPELPSSSSHSGQICVR